MLSIRKLNKVEFRRKDLSSIYFINVVNIKPHIKLELYFI